jgi:hypothetical protein
MVDDTLSLAPEKTGLWKHRALGRTPVLARKRSMEDDTLVNVRGAIAIMLIGFCLFLLFDSDGLRHVARDLPGSAASDALVAAADRWHAVMDNAGLARVAPAARDAFERLRDIGW